MFLDPAYESRVALIEATTGRQFSYGEVAEASMHLAERLRGARSAFLLARNDSPTIVAYLAALMSRVPTLLLSADADETSTAELLARYRPEWVLGPIGAEALDRAGERVDGAWRREAAAVSAVLAARRPGEDLPAPHPELALCLSTSGSTGSPKLVRLSGAALDANARSIVDALGIHEDDRAITSLPPSYSYGLSVVNSHLAAGAALILTDESVLERSFWDCFGRFHATSFAGVPYTYKMLRRFDLDALPTQSLRTLTQAGGRLDVETAQVFQRWIVRARSGRWFTMYGQTEATARIAILPAEDFERKKGSVGRAIPGGRLTIVDGDGNPLPRGEEGEVFYHGPNVMMGYAENPEDFATGDEMRGTLATGDLGRLDDEGYLTVTGRNKRIGKVFGLRINLDEVEDLLREGGPSAALAAEDRLVVFTEWGNDGELAARRKALAERLRVFPRAVEIRRVDALPRTPNGKIDYMRLKDSV